MKSYKIYIIAAICFAVGLAVFLAGFAGLSFNFKNLSKENELTERKYVSKTAVTQLLVDDDNVKVEILPSADESFHITCQETSKQKYVINESGNGILEISKHTSMKWYDYIFNFRVLSNTLTVAVPQNYKGDISVKTSNAEISATGIHGADVALTTSNAEIFAKNLALSGDLQCDTSNGKLNLASVAAQGRVTGNTSNFAVELQGISAKQIETETSNGKITADSLVSQNDIYLKTSNGKIAFGKMQFSTELNCKTSNGQIEGALLGGLGDYSYNCKTSNADCNLPEKITSGKKTVTLKTSNGKIDVDFEK